MPGRYTKEYPVADLLSDVLGRGKSSRLHEKLVKQEQLFNNLNAFVTGSVDPGLLVITGKLNEGTTLEEGEKAIDRIVESMRTELIEEDELLKVKNQAEASLNFSEVELLNRAMNLAFAALQGNPDYVNQEPELIQQVTAEQIHAMANAILLPENSSTLYYRAKKTKTDD